MWLTRSRLRHLGFRQTNPHLWLCVRRYGLRSGDHLSWHDWGQGRAEWVEWESFHLTRPAHGERLHVYYREEAAGEWIMEGHTPSVDFRRLGVCREALQAEADEVARRLLDAVGARLVTPEGSPPLCVRPL